VDRERAEAIAAAPQPEPEDEVDVSDAALSHDLDFVPVFTRQTPDAEMEAISIQSLLEANGIPSVVVGSSQIPSLPFEVRVPKTRLEEAKSLLEEIKQSAADTAAE
jgi:tryptophan synthase alpha subunit